MNTIDWTLFEGAPTTNDWCACGAGSHCPFPAWSASIMHVPAPTTETFGPAIVQTPALAPARLNLTLRPELAEASTWYVSPICAEAGGDETNVIHCWPGGGAFTGKV